MKKIVNNIFEPFNKIRLSFSEKKGKTTTENEIKQKNIFKRNLYLKQSYHYYLSNSKRSDIPLNVYQTFNTLELPKSIQEGVDNLKKNNPGFEFHLFDDIMCRNFIKENFNTDVLKAFDILNPGAFKADLWRYCVLYIKGGIYLDIKYTTDKRSKFKLLDLIHQQYFPRDRISEPYEYIYQAFLISEKNQPIYKKFIDKIVENCINKIKYDDCLKYTGPILVSKIIYKNIELSYNFNCFDLQFHTDGEHIFYKNEPFLKKHNSIKYYDILGDKHYGKIYSSKKESIYNKII